MTAPEISALMSDIMNSPEIPDAIKVRLYRACDHHQRTMSRFNLFYTAIIGYLTTLPLKALAWPKSSLDNIKALHTNGKVLCVDYMEDKEESGMCHLTLGEVINLEDAPKQVQEIVKTITES